MYGPKTELETELEKVSKSGLIHLAKSLARFSWLHREDLLLELVRNAKRMGSALDAQARMQLLINDPDKFIEGAMRRSKAAKKGARRRKKEARALKGGGR
ncbi:hypothetical protein FTO74_14230 [Granulicella sp. WH15]|uniref:hypothetical protein n=1 Tax=Granulicella sp. WH15 TaxID=2602070 RepID=UPI001366D406|nr:hypothetical protein [Granulicella sp. WH15]QHN04389.1 hypothetical protein FTO74_14230 [Granulicella sp. WH15]